MKGIFTLINLMFYAISVFGQTNYYTTTKTFNENGYSYQCDVDQSKGVTLYNKNSKWTNVVQVYKSSGTNFIMDDDCPDVIEFDTWVDPKCDSIVNNAFSVVEKQRVKDNELFITMYVNPDTGKVSDVDFFFVTFDPYATIPVSVYRKIEMDIKQYIWFTPTEEGKKLNYILYWTAVEPK